MDAKAKRRSATILNVNDNEGARYMVTLMLRKAGFEVFEAASGTAALTVVKRELPDLVVLDVKMPDISGFDVCQQIKAEPLTASTKVLLTSATFVTLDKKVQGLEGGADGYLTQPFEQEELIATIRSLLRLTEAEHELRERAERLAEADRRKDEFLAMLAHELRNPLAAITASIPLLEQREPGNELEKKAREVIRRQTKHLARLVDDLLDVSRVTHGKIALKREVIDLTALLTRVTASARERLTEPRSQRLTVVFPEKPVLIEGDQTRLEQVFTNLLDNASKYTDRGGSILVTLSRVADDRSGIAQVVVRDNGIGIDPDSLPAIFGLFTQANVGIARSRGGLGIGLTLVRTLVELHQGTVFARSDGLGMGSEFEVHLPMVRELAMSATPEQAAAESAQPGGGKARDGEGKVKDGDGKRRRYILLVEDNSDAQQSLLSLCEMWGHEVVVASDGFMGVAKAIERPPEIALVDIGLPGIDGYEVARRIRTHPGGKNIFLVALTGYGAPEQRAAALEAGFDLHWVKPVDADQLEGLLRDPAPVSTRGGSRAPRS